LGEHGSLLGLVLKDSLEQLLHCADLRVNFLAQVAHIFLDCSQFGLDLCLRGRDALLLLDGAFELIAELLMRLLEIALELPLRLPGHVFDAFKGALPLLVRIHIRLFIALCRPDHNHKHFLFIAGALVAGEERSLLAHNLQLGQHSVKILVLRNLVEAITHDRNEHINHSYLRVKSGQQEENQD